MARMLGGVRIFPQPNGTLGQGWQGALEVHLKVWTLGLCFLVVDKMMVEEGLRNAQSVKISQIQFGETVDWEEILLRYTVDKAQIKPETAVRV